MIGEWLKANWRPVGAVLLTVVVYALSKFPALSAAHDLFISIGWTLGIFNVFVPSFAKAKE